MIPNSNDSSSVEPIVDKKTRVKALFASAIGSAIEWYDFFLYGTMSALVFNKLFFPNNDAYVSLMLSYASFALAFLIRPIGGILFSHIGDRIGRKKTLIITLSIMGGSTVLMGLLPRLSNGRNMGTHLAYLTKASSRIISWWRMGWGIIISG